MSMHKNRVVVLIPTGSDQKGVLEVANIPGILSCLCIHSNIFSVHGN